MNPVWNSSRLSKPSVRQCSCFQNSVEKPITDQIIAWRFNPSTTSVLDA